MGDGHRALGKAKGRERGRVKDKGMEADRICSLRIRGLRMIRRRRRMGRARRQCRGHRGIREGLPGRMDRVGLVGRGGIIRLRRCSRRWIRITMASWKRMRSRMRRSP